MENNTITENTISDGYPTVGDGGQVVLTVWPKGYSPPIYDIWVPPYHGWSKQEWGHNDWIDDTLPPEESKAANRAAEEWAKAYQQEKNKADSYLNDKKQQLSAAYAVLAQSQANHQYIASQLQHINETSPKETLTLQRELANRAVDAARAEIALNTAIVEHLVAESHWSKIMKIYPGTTAAESRERNRLEREKKVEANTLAGSIAQQQHLLNALIADAVAKNTQLEEFNIVDYDPRVISAEQQLVAAQHSLSQAIQDRSVAEQKLAHAQSAYSIANNTAEGRLLANPAAYPYNEILHHSVYGISVQLTISVDNISALQLLLTQGGTAFSSPITAPTPEGEAIGRSINDLIVDGYNRLRQRLQQRQVEINQATNNINKAQGEVNLANLSMTNNQNTLSQKTQERDGIKSIVSEEVRVKEEREAKVKAAQGQYERAQQALADYKNYGFYGLSQESLLSSSTVLSISAGEGGFASFGSSATATAIRQALISISNKSTQFVVQFGLRSIESAIASRMAVSVGLMSVVFSPSVGEGSDNVPGFFWEKAMIGAVPASMLTLPPDPELRKLAKTVGSIPLNILAVLKHQGNILEFKLIRTPDEYPIGILSAELDSSTGLYQVAIPDVGRTILITPANPPKPNNLPPLVPPIELGTLPLHTGSDVTSDTLPMIEVYPAPESQEGKGWVLVFPEDSGLEAIFVMVSHPPKSVIHNHKHYPPKGVPWSKIVESTKYGGAAKFKPEVNIPEIDLDAWKNGEPIAMHPGWKVKKYDYVIGAFNGKETEWVVVKESQGTVHSYPVSVQQVNRYLK